MTNNPQRQTTFKPVKFRGVATIEQLNTEFARHFAHPNSARVWKGRV